MEGRPLDDGDGDAELVARATAGDAAAYGELVRRHSEVAFRTAWLLTRSAADAEDAAQEAFVKAWQALDRFRPGAPFRPWLLQIVANQARNRRRGAGRYESVRLRAAAQVVPPAVRSPEDVVVDRERAQTLLDALGRLTERDRLVLACRYLLDLGEAETAAVLGCARGTVKSRSARALRRLRAVLEDGSAVVPLPAARSPR